MQNLAPAATPIKQYAVVVNVSRKNAEGWESTTTSPTLYLDERVQGIVSDDHAARIVERWIADLLAGVEGVTDVSAWAVQAAFVSASAAHTTR